MSLTADLSSALASLTKPFTELFAPSATLVNAKESGHLLPPQAEISVAAQEAIQQRFLQNFEYVELNPLMDADFSGKDRLTKTHPHIQFRLCGKDRDAMTQDERISFISRQIDRGVYLLQRYGLNVTDIHVDKEKGALLYDVSFKDILPEGMNAEHSLKAITDHLQAQCSQARAARKESLAL